VHNSKIAKVFNDIADILEIKGENRFRIRAYRRAAQNIESLAKDVTEIKKDDLTEIPGIGSDLADKISELAETGKLRFYEEIKKDVPPGLLDVLKIPGLGPRTAKLFFDKLHIRDIDTLEKLAMDGKLKSLPGIKAKTEENILKGITTLRRHTGRYPIGIVLPLAEAILREIDEKSPVQQLALAGSLRRWKDTIKDIDILATSRKPDKVMDAFVHLTHAKDVIMEGPTKSSIMTDNGIQVDLRVVSEDSFGSALAYFTGSKAHNVRLREMAVKKGLKINEYGIFNTRTDRKLGGRKESDIYRSLGLPFIAPEMREDTGEIEAAMQGKLAILVKMEDIKGDLHVHSNYSDGKHDLMKLVQVSRKKGYKYIAITDHSKGLGIAGGMSVEKLLEQHRRIREINKKLRGFKVLSGTEVDIRSDGTLDYPDEILKKLDMVIASVHSGFRQSREQITRRINSAIMNPFVSIIAHPTGRIIGERDAYEVEMDQILKAAAETSTAMEINAYPFRLDLNDIHVRLAKKMGVMLSVSTDAHRESQFEFMKYGIGIARRGWLSKGNILNTFHYDRLIKFIKIKRDRFA
jgi:DNA polymerase (family 10)